MHKPLISLVIPTLRRADSVDRLLASLLNQDFDLSRLEVLVAMNVNDPVQEKALEKWKGKLNVKGLATGVMGVNKARNLGSTNALADVVLLLDDDMELLQPGLLRQHLEAHQDASLAGLGGSCAMPRDATIPALAYHVIGLAWMYRYRREDGSTPYLLGGHASYKKSIFEEGTRFDDKIEFGGAETSFNLGLFQRGRILRYATELRPVHHNDVTTRNFIRKAYLQGYNGARRKEASGTPRPVIKYDKAVAKVIADEQMRAWQVPLVKFHLFLYDWAAGVGRRASLGEQCAPWKISLVRKLGRVQ